jgi:hypothetical protein
VSAVPNWVRWSALGLLALQLGWILTLPPFRGIDEFDHTYRADAVAHGDWIARPEAATRGTGAILSVSPEIVQAARPECQRLPYTGPEDCVGEPEGERVAIASGAGRYPPLYYALVGYPGSILDGTAALYLMRGVSAMLCTALLTWALLSLTRWSGSRGALAMLLTMTPVVVYSTAVVAPNGLEMIAGLGFWVALGGLAHAPKDDRRNLLLAVVAGVLLVSLRSMGPLWALLILGTALVAWPDLRSRLPVLMRSPAGLTTLGVGVVSGLASVAWVLSQRSLVIGVVDVSEPISVGYRLTQVSAQLILWPLQSIAAFPLRNEPAPPIVYASYALLLIVVVIGAAFRATAPARRGILLTLVLSFAIPWVITVATLTTYGTSWQGRYALPYLAGAAIIAGGVWARRARAVGWRTLAPALLLVMVGQTVGVLRVLRMELTDSPLAGSSLWNEPSPVLVGALFMLGCSMMTLPVVKSVIAEGSRRD